MTSSASVFCPCAVCLTTSGASLFCTLAPTFITRLWIGRQLFNYMSICLCICSSQYCFYHCLLLSLFAYILLILLDAHIIICLYYIPFCSHSWLHMLLFACIIICLLLFACIYFCLFCPFCTSSYCAAGAWLQPSQRQLDSRHHVLIWCGLSGNSAAASRRPSGQAPHFPPGGQIPQISDRARSSQ